MVISHEQLNKLYDAEVVDQDGERVGAMGQIYLDNATGEPAWITVRTGWFGGRRVFVPLTTAEVVEAIAVHVPGPAHRVGPAVLVDTIEDEAALAGNDLAQLNAPAELIHRLASWLQPALYVS